MAGELKQIDARKEAQDRARATLIEAAEFGFEEVAVVGFKNGCLATCYSIERSSARMIGTLETMKARILHDNLKDA